MGRDTKKLHPKLQIIIQKFLLECKKKGFKVGIGECLRTVEEQNALYAQGRTTKGDIVTYAKGTSYGSLHQWGVAFDFYRNDGKGAYYDKDDFFYKVGQIGKKYDLFWGGDFESMIDKPHFQMKEFSKDGTASYLKKKYKSPSAFIATWKKLTVKYKVKKGDTLYDIAKKYNTTVETLAKQNKIKDPSKIRVGQILIIK